MITYVNKSNSDKYSFLYSRASEDLRTHDRQGKPVKYGNSEAALGFDKVELTAETYISGRYYIKDEEKGFKICSDNEFKTDVEYYASDDITSLDEYFSYIEELNRINRRYTILPLDEEVFTINANTRQITVPPSFAQNGIGVQGDEIAEIVYFKINRFFDNIDLNTKDIYIQWRSAATDEQGNAIEGVSVPWVIDIESEPGYIIFGWPLSSKITQKAGNVQFAVRFYEYSEITETLTYSLSTLTQTATIKPALDFDLPSIILDRNHAKIDDSTNLIDTRFENTQLGGATTKAEAPVFILDLPETINLDENPDDNNFRTKDKALDVMAVSRDGGQISYIWKKYHLTTDARLDVVHVITMKSVDITADDFVKEDGVLFYQKDTDGETYILYSGEFGPDAEENLPNGGVFNKFSTGTLNGVGRYVVMATNRVRQSTAIANSTVCTVPYPLSPVINTNLPASAILDGEEFDTTLALVASAQDAGKLTYQWLKKAPGETGYIPIENGSGAQLFIDGEGEKNAENGGVGDGYYKVLITNNLNKENITIESDPCRVTHAASTPVVNSGAVNFKLSDIVEQDEFLEVIATIPDESGENCQRVDGVDEIKYQWYRYIAGLNGNVEEDVLKADEGTYAINGGDRPIESATKSTFQPTDQGYYFCEVTNVYNGTEASKLSRFYRVIEA